MIVFRSPPISAKEETIDVDFSIEGHFLSDNLTVATELLLVKSPIERQRFIAHLAGSRLFTEEASIRIEGTGSRMPVELVSFKSRMPWLSASRAPWHIECSDADLGAPVMRELRVFVNADEPSFAEPAIHGDPIVISVLGANVAIRLLRIALRDEAFVRSEEVYVQGSIADAAKSLAALCFPIHSLVEIASLAEDRPAQFESMIYSALNVTANE
jgi:hypothetical protein